MTEADWLNSTDPQAMLDFLRDSGMLSERNARLFAVACCRCIWHLLTDERSRMVVEVAEKYADGLAVARELEQVRRGDWAPAKLITWIFRSAAPDPSAVDAEAAALFAGLNPLSLRATANAARAASNAGQGDEPFAQCALLRCIFGPLPPIAPWLLQWNGGLIPRLAQQAYDDRLLPSGHLDPQRLGVLSDAIEEAGADAELVGHLRGPGPHAHGCWCVDLLLGKS